MEKIDQCKGCVYRDTCTSGKMYVNGVCQKRIQKRITPIVATIWDEADDTV